MLKTKALPDAQTLKKITVSQPTKGTLDISEVTIRYMGFLNMILDVNI